MSTNEKIKFMADFKSKVTEFLKGEMKVNLDALKSYEEPIKDSDTEIRRMREIEAMKLRHSVFEINRYIAVIDKM